MKGGKDILDKLAKLEWELYCIYSVMNINQIPLPKRERKETILRHCGIKVRQ